MSVFDSKYSLIRRFDGTLRATSRLLHVTSDDALTAEGLVQLSIEEFIAFLVFGTFTESQGFLSGWYTHMTLQAVSYTHLTLPTICSV